MNLMPLYNQRYGIKEAGAFQRIHKVYDELKDRGPMGVAGQTAVGAGVGAGLGGLGVAVGEGMSRAGLKNPHAMDFLKQFHPKSTSLFRGMRGAPLAAVAIPAGIMALIANIRARNVQ